jgi:HEAT repeat protein
MDRAQFDATYGDLWAAKANTAPPDETAVSSLTDVVRTGGSKEERVAAIEALADMGPQAKGADFLLSLLTDPDGQLPWRALEALKPRRDWVPQVLHALTSALKDPAKKIRSRAVTMLMRLGPEASRPALSALREAIQDEDPHVQSHAREAVKLIEANQSKRS